MGIPNEPPCSFAPLFDLERSRLLELLTSLESSDWDLPTPCPGWSVLGLATHLLGGDLGVLARGRDQHFGTPPPDGLDEAGFIGWLDGTQDQWVQAARRLSPRMTLELLRWTGSQVSELIGAQAPSERTASVSWASDQSVPVWLDQCRELSEWWIHRQQLLQATGRPSDLRTDIARPVLEGLKWAFPHRLDALDVGPGATVEIEISGEVDVCWIFESMPNGWQLAGTSDRSAQPHLSVTTEQAWRLLTNNLSQSELDGLSVSASLEIAEVLLQTRAIIGAPKAADPVVRPRS